jgi:tetratricopeptide (TPR) repeat protein
MAVEEKAKLKRYWVEQAVSLALQSRWEEAVTANETILSLFPADVEAHNRLGKAFVELGLFVKAKEAYSKALQLDPSNSIAQKNLARLSNLPEEVLVEETGLTASVPKERGRVEPDLFIEEIGKTGITTLVNLAPRPMLATVTPGTPVQLVPQDNTLMVKSPHGHKLGELESRLGKRLINLMNGGNRYAAAIASIDDHAVKLLIRETYQDPRQVGKPSFPSRGSEAQAFRSYIKESVLRLEMEEEEALEEESEFEEEAEAIEEGAEEAETYDEEVAEG